MTITIFCPYPWRLPAVAAAAVHCLNTMPNTVVQDTVSNSDILFTIHWEGTLLCQMLLCGRRRRIHQRRCCHYTEWDTVCIYRPLRLILYSYVSTANVLIVPHICFHTYPTLNSSSHIYFVVPTVPPIYHTSAAAVSIAPHLQPLIHCHPFLMLLSSHVYDSALIINLVLPFIFHLS